MALREKIRFVGFCGVDDSVSPELLALISSRYPWVEWGVLFRSDLEGTGRYASWKWVESLSSIRGSCGHEMHLAAHLCADRCEQLLSGDSSFVTTLHSLGFNRIQINPTAANNVRVDPERLDDYASNLRSTMNSLPSVEWLFQLNDETRPIWERLHAGPVPPNLSVLHDASCGKGVKIETFPSPQLLPGIPCGYAGGIGPTTISAVLTTIANDVPLYPTDKPVWIDMESSLRSIQLLSDGSQRDVFDIQKAFACALIAASFGLPVREGH